MRTLRKYGFTGTVTLPVIYFVLFVGCFFFCARQIAPGSIARALRVAGAASQPGCFSEMRREGVEPFMSPEDPGERLCSASLGRSQRQSGQHSEKKGSRRVLARHNEGRDGLCHAWGSCFVFLPATLFSRGQNDETWPLFSPLSWRGPSASLFAVTAGSFTCPIPYSAPPHPYTLPWHL